MARMEVSELEPAVAQMEEQIKLLLIPADPQDSKNAIVEIRGGTGGDEAAIFAGDLLRMYTKFVEKRGWKYEINSASEGSSGGFKEVVMKRDRRRRVRRVEVRVGRAPRTARAADRDAGTRPYVGRIGGRTARSRGVRSGDQYERCAQGYFLCVGSRRPVCQYDLFGHPPDPYPDRYRRAVPGPRNGKLKNFDKAFEELRTRIYNLEYQKYLDEIASKRKTMVSTGDRSAKIRTYNYPQGRVTDHRINLTLYNLAAVMDGDIQEIIDKLQVAENAERLRASEEN